MHQAKQKTSQSLMMGLIYTLKHRTAKHDAGVTDQRTLIETSSDLVVGMMSTSTAQQVFKPMLCITILDCALCIVPIHLCCSKGPTKYYDFSAATTTKMSFVNPFRHPSNVLFAKLLSKDCSSQQDILDNSPPEICLAGTTITKRITGVERANQRG